MSNLGRFRDIIIDSEAPDGEQRINAIRTENPGKTIGLASACVDILQPGHTIFFEQIKQIADVVVISLGRDSVVGALKPGRPIIPEGNRAYLVAAMKPVDYVVLGSSFVEEGKVDFRRTLEVLKPDFFVLNSDDSALGIKRALCESLGITLKIVDRVVPDFLIPTSTTEIIDRIRSSQE